MTIESCPVCGSNNWETLFKTSVDRVMTGDQRIVSGNLHKIICQQCGVVRNANKFSDEELERLYGEEYELNTYGHEEHLFYTKEGPIARSQVFCDWIAIHLPESGLLTEIGCGEGLLLEKIRLAKKELDIKGYDGSHEAARLAQAKGLDVKQKIIVSSESNLVSSDVFLLVNVIEHVEDLEGIFSLLKNHLHPGGKIVFCLPIQDYGGYDIFFQEHVWHFTADHFAQCLLKSNLQITHTDINHPINHGIGLFVCEVNNQGQNDKLIRSTLIADLYSKWEGVFRDFDHWLEQTDFERIAAFGGGEVFTLFYTFTQLSNKQMVCCIDDTPTKIGTRKHGITVIGSKDISDYNPDLILITVNQKYVPQLKERFKNMDAQVESVYRT